MYSPTRNCLKNAHTHLDPTFLYDKVDKVFAPVFYTGYEHNGYIGECTGDNYYNEQQLYDTNLNVFQTIEFFKFDNDQAITDSSNFERIKIYSERNNDIIVADDKSVHVADIDLGQMNSLFFLWKGTTQMHI